MMTVYWSPRGNSLLACLIIISIQAEKCGFAPHIHRHSGPVGFKSFLPLHLQIWPRFCGAFCGADQVYCCSHTSPFTLRFNFIIITNMVWQRHAIWNVIRKCKIYRIVLIFPRKIVRTPGLINQNFFVRTHFSPPHLHVCVHNEIYTGLINEAFRILHTSRLSPW